MHIEKQCSIPLTNLNVLRWLVGCLFWAKRPFETVYQSISDRLRERGGKKSEKIDERKMSKQPLPAPTASAVGPCPTL